MSQVFKYTWPIIGQQKIRAFLQTEMNNKSLNHAYLFHGPEKVGKTFTAKMFAKSILCENYQHHNRGLIEQADVESVLPCGKCEPCRQFENGTYADLYIVERLVDEKTGKRKDQIIATQIRELIEKTSKRSFLNSYKIVIIPEAHLMNEDASNCLLKTLEEPTSQTIIILISTSKHVLLPTILSRCQSLKFLPVNRDEIYEYLVKEGANRSLARDLSSFAIGRPTVARHFLTASEEWQGYQQDAKELLKVFNSTAVEKFKLVESLAKKETSDDEIFDRLNHLSGLCRDLLLMQCYNNEEVSHLALANELTELAKKFTGARLTSFLKQIEMTKKFIKQNVNARFAVENLVLNI